MVWMMLLSADCFPSSTRISCHLGAEAQGFGVCAEQGEMSIVALSVVCMCYRQLSSLCTSRHCPYRVSLPLVIVLLELLLEEASRAHGGFLLAQTKMWKCLKT